MRDGDAVFQGGGTKFLAALEGFQQSLGVVKPLGELSQGDEFTQDTGLGAGFEAKIDADFVEHGGNEQIIRAGLAVGADAGVHTGPVVFIRADLLLEPLGNLGTVKAIATADALAGDVAALSHLTQATLVQAQVLAEFLDVHILMLHVDCSDTLYGPLR